MTQAPNWYDDPFGRHPERFYDGTRWTSHVRDGDVHAVDEPPTDAEGGAVSPTAPVSPAAVPVVPAAPAVPRGQATPAGGASSSGRSLLTEPLLVVRPRPGTEVSRPYDVLDAAGVVLGAVRPVGRPAPSRIVRAVTGTDTPLSPRLEITDGNGAVVLTLVMPTTTKKKWFLIHDATGTEIGKVVQTKDGGRSRMGLEGPHGFAGYVVAEDWLTWELRIEDRGGRTVARVSRTAPDPGAPITADSSVVRIEQPVPEPLRSLVVASTLCLDAAFATSGR